MTNTPMSEREKELVEAVRLLLQVYDLSHDNISRQSILTRTKSALHAYDPKPEPVPVIPAWEEFCKEALLGKIGRQFSAEQSNPDVLTIGGIVVYRSNFDLIRILTSKAPTE